MLKKYLEKISKVKIELIETKLVDWKILNLVIFWSKISKNLEEYKKKFLKEMFEKTYNLNEIILDINIDEYITKIDKKILEKEIFVKLKKIEFLKKVYDIEANKLNSNYIVQEELEDYDYDYYNKIFYWFSIKDLDKDVIISENKETNIFIPKCKLEKLLEYSKKIIPELKWAFWNFVWLSHDSWILNIPYQEEYNINRIITIFFHEMTHLFRYINWKKNLGFSYEFSDYDTLEEGISTYNELYYWNKIIYYWKYNEYYDKCYQIILDDKWEEEKKEELYLILKKKGFVKEKIDLLYTRFYRYSNIWGKKLFLKELIYTDSYNNVLKLIKEDKKNYDKIMAWTIWLFELENKLIDCKYNINSKEYFEKIAKKIKDIT